MSYMAKEYCMSKGIGVSSKRLPSFDRALLDAGVGNYNLVRLSSILPAHCKRIDVDDIKDHIEEGSLLPTAYSTISSNEVGQMISSAIGVGIPKDKEKVGVIMEFSTVGMDWKGAEGVIHKMVHEAFQERGWEIDTIECVSASAVVENEGDTVTTFACISEW